MRSLAGFDIRFDAFGTLIHVRSPSGLSLALLDRSGDDSARALALGALTHYAVDLVFHDEIHRRVRQVADGTESLDTVHKRIEDDMDLHVHYDLLGHSGIGTPYARQMLALRPHRSWAATARDSMLEVHGEAPDERKLISWLDNLSAFGWLSSTRHVPWVHTLPADDPELLETSLQLAERSLELSADFVRAGLDYLDGELDRGGFFDAVPDRSMLDGGPADPPASAG
ncbi:MAG: hypothetical protein JRF63_11585 [Deltaproteobacteria bacterium]|nr:hypothetical protein [Deltaproteobacteria bacterium]